VSRAHSTKCKRYQTRGLTTRAGLHTYKIVVTRGSISTMSNRNLNTAAVFTTAQTQALLTNLKATITDLAASLTRTPPTVVTDHYSSNKGFDLSTRAGDYAFENISKALNTMWDITVQSILKRQASNGGWDPNPPHGVLTVAGKNVIDDSTFIFVAAIKEACTGQTNARAQRNYKALFICLESPITSLVKSTIFDQPKNKYTGQDEVEFCSKLTQFTTLASTQLSILSQNKLLVFDPSADDYNIS